MSEQLIPRTAKGKRPVYFQDPATDKILAIVLALVEELAVTRDRLDAVERLLQEHNLLQQDEVDSFTAVGVAEEERSNYRAEYIQRVLRIVASDTQLPDEDGATEAFTSVLRQACEVDD